MIGQVAIVLVSFVDNIMVGNHSLDELAAAAFVNNFLNLLLVLGMGFSYGLTPLVAESHKLNRPERAGLYLKAAQYPTGIGLRGYRIGAIPLSRILQLRVSIDASSPTLLLPTGH